MSREETGTYQGNLIYFLISFLKVSNVKQNLFESMYDASVCNTHKVDTHKVSRNLKLKLRVLRLEH